MRLIGRCLAKRNTIFESSNHSMGGVLRYSLVPRDGFGCRWWYRGSGGRGEKVEFKIFPKLREKKERRDSLRKVSLRSQPLPLAGKESRFLLSLLADNLICDTCTSRLQKSYSQLNFHSQKEFCIELRFQFLLSDPP